MPDQYESFRNAVSGSKVLTERWDRVSDSAIEIAARDNIKLTREDLIQLDSIRLHVLTGEEVGINWREEAEHKLLSFAKHAENCRIRDALIGDDSDAKTSAQKVLEGMNPTQKMQFARANGEKLQGPATTKKNLSESEKIAALKQLQHLRGPAKVAMARKLGLE